MRVVVIGESGVGGDVKSVRNSTKDFSSAFGAVPSLKARAALTTAYAAGLRASEAASLKVGNIDSSRMVMRIDQGNGSRDRYVMLSPQLLAILRSSWRIARPTY